MIEQCNRTLFAAMLLAAGCVASDAPTADSATPLTIDSFDSSGELQAHMTVNDTTVLVQSHFLAAGDKLTRTVTIRGEDGTLYAERDIGIDGSAPSGTLGGRPFGHPGDPDDQRAWNELADSAQGRIIAAVGRASANAAVASDAEEALDEVVRVAETLDELAGRAANDAPDAENTAFVACGFANFTCPKIRFWNHVCSSSASMWPNHFERGNAPYELAGTSDVYNDAVYIYDIRYGRRAAHVLALKGPVNRGGPPFPEHRVAGYLNMTGNLCACPRNAPISCSPYRN